MEHKRRTGVSPSNIEMGAAIGRSGSSAWIMLKSLEAKGWVRRVPGTWRGIIVLQEPPQTEEVCG